MEITTNAPLLYIDNATMAKAVKDPAMTCLCKNWETFRENVYSDDSTFRIDLEANRPHEELKRLLGAGDDINTIYIEFSSKNKRDEFIEVFLNKNLEHGLSDTYGDIGAGRMKKTAEYKRRKKIMDGITA